MYPRSAIRLRETLGCFHFICLVRTFLGTWVSVQKMSVLGCWDVAFFVPAEAAGPLAPAFAVPVSNPDEAKRGSHSVCASASLWLCCKLGLLVGDGGVRGIGDEPVQWKDGRGPFSSCACHLLPLGPLASHTPSSRFVKSRQLSQPHKIAKHARQVLAELIDCKNAVIESSVIRVSSKSVASGVYRTREVSACASEAGFDVVTV